MEGKIQRNDSGTLSKGMYKDYKTADNWLFEVLVENYRKGIASQVLVPNPNTGGVVKLPIIQDLPSGMRIVVTAYSRYFIYEDEQHFRDHFKETSDGWVKLKDVCLEDFRTYGGHADINVNRNVVRH